MNFKESHKTTSIVYRSQGGLHVSSWADRFVFLGRIPAHEEGSTESHGHTEHSGPSPLPPCAMGTSQTKCLFHRAEPICSAPHSPFVTCTEDLSICLLTAEILMCGHLSAAGQINRKEYLCEKPLQLFMPQEGCGRKKCLACIPSAELKIPPLRDNNSSSKSDGDRKTIRVNTSACLVITQHQCLITPK